MKFIGSDLNAARFASKQTELADERKADQRAAGGDENDISGPPSNQPS